MKFAQIILPLHIKGTFTYKVPEDLQNQIAVGMRVLVPFRGKKIYTGIVDQLHNNEPEKFVARAIVSILDEVPILTEIHLKFWHWISTYYFCNIGELYRFAFPGSLKLESETYLKLKPNLIIDYEILDVNELYLIQALEVRQLLNLSDIEAFIPKKNLVKTINSLIDLQYIEVDEKIAEKYKSKEVAYLKIEEYLLDNQKLTDLLSKLGKAEKQKELFLYLLDQQTANPDSLIRKSTVLSEGKFGSATLKALKDKNLVTEYLLEMDRIDFYKGNIEQIEELSPEQKVANDEISTAFQQNQNVLLHGVTSSGKTHLYLEKIEEALSKNKKVLYLLPEIALTKQITQRLEKKYGPQLGFYHQKLTDFERVEIWKKINNNTLNLIIGTRNALFLPFRDLGLIIVDEEHDMMYRPKEASPYFNAKDAALVLAGYYDAKVILGSATPSLESYYAAQKNKLKYIFIGERFGNVPLPEFEIINFQEAQDSKQVKGNLSTKLLEEFTEKLGKNQQVIVLHNKRGYASIVECESCGYVAYCSNCDVVLTFHKSSNELKCHYCGQKAPKPSFCPKCNSQNLNTKGIGVEQIEEEIAAIFPDVQVDRMDVDAMRKKFAYEKLFEKIEKNETQIIVGTQMISKGLDFNNIELAAIPRADQLLHIPDFRAEERAYQLITQTAGRCGRMSGKGKVLIQTFHPEKPIFNFLIEKKTKELYDYLLAEREKYHYPPFTKIVLIELSHRKADKIARAASFFGSIIQKYFPQELIFGPEKSPVPKINLQYYYQLYLKLPRGKAYHYYKNLIEQSLEEFDEITAYQSVKRNIYVDF